MLDKAHEFAARARSLDGVNPRIAATLGWVLYKRHDFQQARDLLNEARAKLGDDATIQFRFGLSSYMMDDSAAARAAFSTASASESPVKAEAVRWLAALNDPNAPEPLSIDELLALVARNPGDVGARMRLAALCERTGDYAKAAAHLTAAIDANPSLLGPRLKLAQLYAGPLHDIQKAMEFAKAARELDKHSPETAPCSRKRCLPRRQLPVGLQSPRPDGVQPAR